MPPLKLQPATILEKHIASNSGKSFLVIALGEVGLAAMSVASLTVL
jgi:hypothetical protein